MIRKIYFEYHLLGEEYRELFENDIIKTDLENSIKNYIAKYHLYIEDDYILTYNDKIKIDFNIEYCYNFEFYIRVNNIIIND